jgi:hypothetical protein
VHGGQLIGARLAAMCRLCIASQTPSPDRDSASTFQALGTDAPVNTPSVPRLTLVGAVGACVCRWCRDALKRSGCRRRSLGDARARGHSGGAVHPQLVVALHEPTDALCARVDASRVLSTMPLADGLALETRRRTYTGAAPCSSRRCHTRLARDTGTLHSPHLTTAGTMSI